MHSTEWRLAPVATTAAALHTARTVSTPIHELCKKRSRSLLKTFRTHVHDTVLTVRLSLSGCQTVKRSGAFASVRYRVQNHLQFYSSIRSRRVYHGSKARFNAWSKPLDRNACMREAPREKNGMRLSSMTRVREHPRATWVQLSESSTQVL